MIDVLSGLHHQIELTDDDFSDIEAKSGVMLTAEQRERVQTIVRIHELYCARETAFRGSKSDRARISKSIRLIESLMAELTALLGDNPTLAKWLGYPADIATKMAEIDDLGATMRAHIADKNKKGPVPIFVPLGRLLLALEPIFIERTGKATNVVHDRIDETRYSAFIDFAWQVILRLPEQMRPETHQALASVWEEVDTARKLSQAARAKGERRPIKLERRPRGSSRRR